MIVVVHFFNALYVSGFLDDYTGKLQLRVINGCDAIAIATVFFNDWVPDNGFPIQMIGDLGSSNYNDLMDIVHDVFGISGIYSSPRFHPAIGKVERKFQEMHKHFRALNIILDGTINDANERDQAIFQVRQFLPSIESFMNNSINHKTGLSPQMLDKGRQLRGIVDIKNALSLMKKRIQSGLKKKDQIEYLRDLQKRIHCFAQQRQKYLFPYLMRNVNKHIGKENKYRKGEYVGYFIGDMKSKNVGKWEARYKKCIFMKELNSGQCEILDLQDNKIIQTTKRYLKPYMVNDPLWKTEFDYQVMQQQQQQQYGVEKHVTFG